MVEAALVVEDAALVVAMELVLEELLTTTTDVAVVALEDDMLPEVTEAMVVVALAAEPVAEPEPEPEAEPEAEADEAVAKKAEQSLAAALWALIRSLGEQLEVRQPATMGSSLAWFFALHWQA